MGYNYYGAMIIIHRAKRNRIIITIGTSTRSMTRRCGKIITITITMCTLDNNKNV